MPAELFPAEPPRPAPNTYWVIPGRLLAGAYPSDPRSLKRLLDAGITCFIDLTEEGEASLWDYQALLRAEAGRRKVELRYFRRPVVDFQVPTFGQMQATLALIQQQLHDGQRIYLHCQGGRGRTGTVVGCWLVQQGQTAEAALRYIPELRAGLPNADRSPETPEQKAFVLNWERLKR